MEIFSRPLPVLRGEAFPVLRGVYCIFYFIKKLKKKIIKKKWHHKDSKSLKSSKISFERTFQDMFDAFKMFLKIFLLTELKLDSHQFPITKRFPLLPKLLVNVFVGLELIIWTTLEDRLRHVYISINNVSSIQRLFLVNARRPPPQIALFFSPIGDFRSESRRLSADVLSKFSSFSLQSLNAEDLILKIDGCFFKKKSQINKQNNSESSLKVVILGDGSVVKPSHSGHFSTIDEHFFLLFFVFNHDDRYARRSRKFFKT